MVHFCLKKFISEKILKKISLEICVRNSVLVSGNLAEMHTMTEDEFGFSIEFGNRLGFHRIMLSIAHECVHIKQYLLKELVDEDDDTITFLGKNYNMAAIDYWDWPWEIEAHGREHGLLLRFVQANNLQGASWIEENIM